MGTNLIAHTSPEGKVVRYGNSAFDRFSYRKPWMNVSYASTKLCEKQNENKETVSLFYCAWE
jgi:hypothetical protein